MIKQYFGLHMINRTNCKRVEQGTHLVILLYVSWDICARTRNRCNFTLAFRAAESCPIRSPLFIDTARTVHHPPNDIRTMYNVSTARRTHATRQRLFSPVHVALH